MWPFKKTEVTKGTYCPRHHLLELLDEATKACKAEEDKLEKLKEERRNLIEQLIHFAEDKYFRRYEIMEEERLDYLTDRSRENAPNVGYRAQRSRYIIIGPNIHFRYNYHPVKSRKEALDDFFDLFGMHGVVPYINKQDFKDCPETYELVRLLVTVIKNSDEAIRKQEKIYNDSKVEIQKILKRIEESSKEKE